MLKNTIFLYIRMFVIMCINLIAVRLLLQALGETDYGIFNVVGGVVAMLSFLSSSMSSAAQRFYASYIGTGNIKGLRQVFGVSIMVFLLIVVVTIMFGETIGLWFVVTKLTIPIDRLSTASWVYQFSIITFSINMLCVPFIALVIASERMDFYSFISVIDSVLKLLIILIIRDVFYDRLLFYSILYMFIAFANIVVYSIYTHYYLKNEVSILPKCNRIIFKELFSYCSWYMFGAIAQVLRSQGINILLNIFFNPIVNAARGLAYQVNAAVNMFVTSFYQAVRPQIIKRYAAKEINSMQSLVFKSTKLSFYLVLIVAIPLIVIMPKILLLWLRDVPDNTVLFTRLVIIVTMIETTGYPLSTSICADGNIKLFQIVSGGILLLTLPISYICLVFGGKPETTMYIAILMAVIAQLVRIYFAKRLFSLNLRLYCKITFIMIITTMVSFIVPLIVKDFFPAISLSSILANTMVDITWILLVIYSIGLSADERLLVLTVVKKHLKKSDRNEI